MPLEHWRYFLVIEQDLETTTRFVEPAQANFGTYSIEFARILLSTCSEIEVVSKVLCETIDPNRAAQNMDNYRDIITTKYPRLHTLRVNVPRFGLSTDPWKDWGTDANPQWWRDHQQVKHARHQNFSLATLERCMTAMAGLFGLLVYLHHQELFALKLNPKPSLLALENQPFGLVGGKYSLPDFP